MNWRYQVGRRLDSALHTTLASRLLPLNRYAPWGVSWIYDAQRAAGIRDFGVAPDVGQTARRLAAYLPRTNIYCFEPVSATFGRLKDTTAGSPNVRCVHSSLGSEAGQVTIRLRHDSELNSLFGTGPLHDGEPSEQITVMTVDAFCDEHGIESIDILKMDVRGYELEVLRGAERKLTNDRIRFIYAEVGFAPNDPEMQYFGSLHETLIDRGFALSGFYEPFR